MRIIEIILKLAFLILAVYVISTQHVFGHAFMWLVYTGLVLGILLIFNKKQSYRYPANHPKLRQVFILRRIEGVILILAALVVFFHS